MSETRKFRDLVAETMTMEQIERVEAAARRLGGGWNYRVLRTVDKHGEHFGIHEVYYDAEGRPTGYTDPHAPYGETSDELASEMDMMRQAFDRPPLDEADFTNVDISQVEISPAALPPEQEGTT